MTSFFRVTRRLLHRMRSATITALVRIGTLPYYRFFYFNTLGVLQRIAIHAQDPNDCTKLLKLLKHWRIRKLAELQFISIASAVLAGAVIGSFSWFSITSAFWLASACWYASLVLSILAILLAAQQISVFHFLGDVSELDPKSGRSTFERYRSLLIENVPNNRNQSLDPEVSRFRSKSTMVFIWQCPMMFMSYSVCLFLLGLTLVVITPLIRLRRQGWNGDVNAAIFYLATTSLAGAAFVFCSFWIYHFVDFESDSLIAAAETQQPQIPMAPQQNQVDIHTGANQIGSSVTS